MSGEAKELNVEVWPGGMSTKYISHGSGPPLLYLHGITGVEPTDPVIRELARTWSVIAPMSPGFADVEELREFEGVHDLAFFYDELLTALGVDRATVVGHSFGGMAAAELAAHAPHRVEALVMAAPFGLWDEHEPSRDFFLDASAGRIDDVLWADPQGQAAADFRSTVDEGDPAGTSHELATLLRVVQGLTAVAHFTWPLPDKGLRRRLRRITAASTVVWGRLDQVVPVSYADRFVSGVSDCAKVVLGDAGHMVPYEDPVWFAEVVSSAGERVNAA